MKLSFKSNNMYRNLLIVSMILLAALASVHTIAQTDNTPVNIENVSVYALDSSVIIYWDTDILSDSLVKYGLSEDNLSYNNYLGVHSLAHAAEIMGLVPNTTYYFVVNSTNANSQSNESIIYYFSTLADTVAPIYSGVSVVPDNTSSYSKNASYSFSAKWTDNGIISNVSIKHNFRNANYSYNSMQNIPGTDIYNFNLESLAAGNYSWQMDAEDMSGNHRQSDTFSYVVNKSEPAIMLALNNATQEISVEQRTSVAIIGQLFAGDCSQNSLNIIIRNASSILNQSSFTMCPFVYNSTSSYLVPTNENPANISMMHYFENPGTYNVSVSYNESENYTHKSISYVVNVTPIEAALYIDKPEYNTGDTVNYVVLAPNSSNLSVEICGPLLSGPGFVECRNIVSNVRNNYPYSGTSQITNKTGTYRIRAQIQYKGLTKYSEKNYTVVNNIQITTTGETVMKIGDTSSIVASATGGVGTLRYNWTLLNGTKIYGPNLNVKYNIAGTYPAVLTVNDDAGNYKTATVSLVYKKYYVVKILVLDIADNSEIESARVKMEGTYENTDENGYASFSLIEGSYDMRVSKTGYSSYSETIKSDSNKTLTVKLTKLNTSSAESLDVTLTSPAHNTVMNSQIVNFEAYVDMGGNSQATCMFYISEDNNDWYRVMKTVSVQTSGKITHSEEFGGGNYFSWKVQCDSGTKTYVSDVWKFVSTNQNEEDAQLTIIGEDSEIVDAGEIRRRIDLALSNIDSMDIESKKDADALKFSENVNRALRDYERAMRDISNIKFRKDLSEAEQESKKLEYYNSLRGLEDTVPLEIKNLGYETFISYPSKEDVYNLSREYQLQKNIVGRANENVLSQLQNGIIVTTRISNTEITYLSGKKELVTLVIKSIKINDNSTDTFILEYIPKGIAGTTEEIFFTPEEIKVINKDPLVKLDKQTEIVYYVKGEKDLQLGKDTKTILLTDKAFSTRNSITGDVTFSSLYDIDFTSPVSLVILIVIVSSIYLLYAFDIFGGLFEKSRRKWKVAKINKILALIDDAKEFLVKGDIARADLLFKEIQLVYENSPDEIREEVYSPALGLLEMIDSVQLEGLMKTAETNTNKVLSNDEKEKINNSRMMLKEAYNLLSQSLKEKYEEKLKLLADETIQKEGAES